MSHSLPCIICIMISLIVTPPPIGKRSILMSVSVCLCVCLSAIISSELHVRSLQKKFVHVTYGRILVLFWRRSDKLCTSGFMDDVKFVHKPRLLDIATCRPTYARYTFRTLKVTSQVAATGAESAVHNCLVANWQSYWESLCRNWSSIDRRSLPCLVELWLQITTPVS